MMFMDEHAEVMMAKQRLEATRQEIAAFRMARHSSPAGRLGAVVDGALIRATQGAVRRQAERQSRADPAI